MTDSSWNDELSEAESNRLDALLANPELWEEPDQADEDAIVAAILAEAGDSTVFERPTPTASTSIESVESVESPESPSQELTDHRGQPDPRSTAARSNDSRSNDGRSAEVIPISQSRRWLSPALGAAAGLLIALIGVATFNAIGAQDEDGVVELALAGTDLAPAAQATAKIVDLPAGTRVELDVSSLDPAPPGSYYELWLRQDAEVGVSAGTFHLRGGDSEIELWAGVSTTEYPLVTVTIQDEAEPTSSGRVVLKGLLTSG